MKLRLRSAASKETLKVDVPSDCTLMQLRHLIADRIGAASASSSITISLNRKDEIIGAPDESLHLLGIASGDLLFYSTDFTVFVPNTLALGSEPSGSSRRVAASCEVGMIDCRSSEAVGEAKVVEEVREVGIGEEMVEGTRIGDEDMVEMKANETLEFEQSGDGLDEENMTVDVSNDASIDANLKRKSTPYFLKNVWNDEQGELLSGYHLLVVAVQAVLVESGFVRLDIGTGAPVYEFLVPNGEAPAKTMTLRYTLGELIELKPVVCEFVTVKMFKWGRHLFVYGDISGNKYECYTLKLDETLYVRNMELERRKRKGDGDDSEGVLSNESHDSEVLKFYKEVKDKLALPLLIDICHKAGLPQPTCLMLLPTELKLKIFELVSGADLAKLACQCSELRYLNSDNSLWKMMYVKEFGNGGNESTNWKQKFVSSWKKLKAMREGEKMYRHNRLAGLNRPLRHHRPPPFGSPFIIGGDYDLYPFGDGGPYTAPFGSSSGRGRQPAFPYPSFQPSRRFSPDCDCDGDGGSLL